MATKTSFLCTLRVASTVQSLTSRSHSWKTEKIRSGIFFTQTARTFGLLTTQERADSIQELLQKSSVKNCIFTRGYKALVLEEVGKSLKLKDVKPQKKLQADEVRVAVHCCGVNNADILICAGEYETKPKVPFIPGFEVSGEVMEVGSKVSEFSVGDRVIGMNKEGFSGFGEECVIPVKDLWRIPQSMCFKAAASLVDCYTTVLIAARRVKLQEGDTVLVTAAGGGLGLAAVDVAANLFKAKVFGVCGTEDKASLVRDKGAFAAINYNKKELVEAVKKQTDGVGVNVVFDAVGGDMFEDCLECICHEGSIIVAGFASRRIPHILTSQLLPKSCALIGVSLTHYRLIANDLYRHTVQEVIDMYQEEFFEPHISATFEMDEIKEAFKFIEGRKSTGKVVLKVR